MFGGIDENWWWKGRTNENKELMDANIVRFGMIKEELAGSWEGWHQGTGHSGLEKKAARLSGNL